jgi:hypothetical protein
MEFYDKYNKYKTKYLELKQFYTDFYGAGRFAPPKKGAAGKKPAGKGAAGKDKAKGSETPPATPRKEVEPISEYITKLPCGESIYLIYYSTEPKIQNNHRFTINENNLDKNLNFFYINKQDVDNLLNDTLHNINITPIIYIKNKNIINDMKKDTSLAIETYMNALKEPLIAYVNYNSQNLGQFFKDIIAEIKKKINVKINWINEINKDIQKYLYKNKDIPMVNYSLYKFKSIELKNKNIDVILIENTVFKKNSDNIIFGEKKYSMKK